MKAKGQWMALALVCLLLCALVTGAAAESVDVSRRAELRVSYVVKETPIADVGFSLYRVADVDAAGKFTLSGQFASLPVSLSNTSTEGLRNLAQTLSGYVALGGYTPEQTGRTNRQGELDFGFVATGMYLVVGESVVRGEMRYNPGASVVTLPFVDDSGSYNYGGIMHPKQDVTELTHIRAEKVWEDRGAENLRPTEITVRLLRDNEVYSTRTLSAATSWRTEWTQLDASSSWNVVEDVPENYDVTVSVDGELFTLTNRYRPAPTPVPTVDLTGHKRWEDESDAAGIRPASINVTLYANGVATDDTPHWDNVTGDIWTFTFSDLPQMDENGAIISYTVQEEPVPYYETTVDGMTIINRIVPPEPQEYVEIAGHKTWRGDTEADRPSSITVTLLRDGEAVDERVVTAANGWIYSFGELPKDDGYGHIYTYTVSEQMVNGYYALINGLDIVNTRVPTPPDEPDEPGEPRTPRTPRTPPFEEFSEEGLEELIDIFDYDVPLWGGLLKTGVETPLYPFIFGGIGVLAVILLLVFGRKKKAK